jgi:hypothetical protein
METAWTEELEDAPGPESWPEVDSSLDLADDLRRVLVLVAAAGVGAAD